MKKLIAIPVLLALGDSGLSVLAAALWVPAIAALPLTAILSLCARRGAMTRLFFANLLVVILIGLLGAAGGGNRPGPASDARPVDESELRVGADSRAR